MAHSKDTRARSLKVGVLALQGSYREHCASFRRCSSLLQTRNPGYQVEAVEVRKPEDLHGLHGLVIPGGESTTMANLAQRNGLLSALRDFEASSRPIWGTCAGLIFLSNKVHGQKEGGQALVGGLDCTVHRNYFGSQINSFEALMPFPAQLLSDAAAVTTEDGGTGSSAATAEPFRAIFIRAPAIVEAEPSVEVLVEYPPRDDRAGGPEAAASTEEQTPQPSRVAVAVRQARLLATAFHPELTTDLRWHLAFLGMVIAGPDALREEAGITSEAPRVAVQAPTKDLPVFAPAVSLVLEKL